MGNIQTVGPNEALIVSGGCCRPSRKSVIVGGWCWSTWMLTNIQRISLQVMSIEPKCEKVQSRHGVPVSVNGVVHCKIMSSHLPDAAEQFLGKSVDDIKNVVKQTVEGHMRAVIGTQAIEDICKKRQGLASMIREVSIKDLNHMGIDILSLTIKEIKDEVQYIDSAGKKTAALVKRDADVEVARSTNEAEQVEKSCKHEEEERRLHNNSLLETKKHNMELAKANYSESVGKAKAEAEKAYDWKMACLERDIKKVEMEVAEIEFDGHIKIQRKENERHQTELEIEVGLPTKAEIYEMQKQDEARAAMSKAELEAEEYRIKIEGKAKAEAARIEGTAEAEGMKLVAEARKEFNEAAVLFEVLKVLPDVAAEIASPLSKFHEIVLVSDGKDKNGDRSSSGKLTSAFAAEAAKMSSALPMAVKAVGGSDSTSSSLLNAIMQLQKSAI